MEEKVDFCSDAPFLENLVQMRFKRNDSLDKDELLYFLNDIEQNLDTTSYQVSTKEELVIRKRFSDGLVYENTLDSQFYTQNGITLRIAN